MQELKELHIVAHSMGNYLFHLAITEQYAPDADVKHLSRFPSQEEKDKFVSVLFCAPDVARKDFRNMTIPTVLKLAEVAGAAGSPMQEQAIFWLSGQRLVLTLSWCFEARRPLLCLSQACGVVSRKLHADFEQFV